VFVFFLIACTLPWFNAGTMHQGIHVTLQPLYRRLEVANSRFHDVAAQPFRVAAFVSVPGHPTGLKHT